MAADDWNQARSSMPPVPVRSPPVPSPGAGPRGPLTNQTVDLPSADAGRIST